MQHAVVVVVHPIGLEAAELGISQLRQAPGGVAGCLFGLFVVAGAPVALAGVGPAVLIDVGAVLFAEPLNRLAAGDGALDGTGEIREQVRLGRAGHHERAVVLRLPEVGPLLGGRLVAEANSQRLELLGELEPRIGGSHAFNTRLTLRRCRFLTWGPAWVAVFGLSGSQRLTARRLHRPRRTGR